MIDWHTGEEIRKLLKARGLRSDALAEQLGVSRATVFNVLNRAEWPRSYAEVAATWLQVDFRWLMLGDRGPAVSAAMERAALKEHPSVLAVMERMHGLLDTMRDELINAVIAAYQDRQMAQITSRQAST